MTEVSLREYLDQRLVDFDRRLTDARESDDKRVQLALTAAKEAVDKADLANERRLNHLNEFRAAMSDESKKYAPREILDAHVAALSARLGSAEQTIASIQGRALALAGVGAIVGGAVVGAIMNYLGS